MTSAPEVIPAQPIHPGRRLLDGLAQTVRGALNIVRGTVGLGASTVWTVLSLVLRAVRRDPPEDLGPLEVTDLTAAPEAPARRNRTPLVIAVLAVGLLAVIGGVAAKLLRTRPAPPVAAEPPRVRQFPTAEEIAAENSDADEDSADTEDADGNGASPVAD